MVTGRSVLIKRTSHSQSHLTSETSQDVENDKTDSSELSSASNSIPSANSLGEGSTSVKYSVMSKLKTSSRHDTALVFTCKVCETRSVKLICKESYEKGVVVVRCGGCNNNHLIADRLGWFGEPGSIEDLLAAQGEEVRKGSIDSLNFTADDLVGKQK